MDSYLHSQSIKNRPQDWYDNLLDVVAGSNGKVTREYIDKVLTHFSEGDLIVLQNEISCVGYAIDQASKKGLTIAFNPSPLNQTITSCDMKKVDLLLVEEVESAALFGSDNDEIIAEKLKKEYPGMSVVLTKGIHGSSFLDAKGNRFFSPVLDNEAVDTTAAGNTFTGYFLHGLAS